MTRLNIVDAKDLTTKHLVAEYKEILQFLHHVKKRVDNNHPFDDIPPKYTLNGGHCLFFFNKGQYVYNRFVELYEEMHSRGLNVNEEKYAARSQRIIDSYNETLFQDWVPSKEDYGVAIERIVERIEQKPHLYPDANRFYNAIPTYK